MAGEAWGAFGYEKGEDVVSVGLAVAEGEMNYEQLLAWVREHRTENEV